MGQTALLPLRRKAVDFFRPKIPTASAGFEPAILGTRGQHANHHTTGLRLGRDYGFIFALGPEMYYLCYLHIVLYAFEIWVLTINMCIFFVCSITVWEGGYSDLGERRKERQKISINLCFLLAIEWYNDVIKYAAISRRNGRL
jgi:hypothetical protein